MGKTIVGLTVLMALTIASCSKNETFEDNTSANAIEFANLNDRIPSKAANDSTSNYGVYALASTTVSPATDWFMENQEIDGADNSYQPPKFWPKEGTVSFYAYAPYNSGNIDQTKVEWNATAPVLDVVYTVPVDADEDFTIADPVLDKSSGLVSLLFSHMLSKVSFEALLATDLKDEGFAIQFNHATLSMEYQQGKTSLISPTGWTLTLPATSATYTGKTNYMVMPQPTTNMTIVLNVTITLNGNHFFTGNMKALDLTAVPTLTEFIKGMNYLFSVTVGNLAEDEKDDPIFDVIFFSSGMAPWGMQTIPII